MADTATGSPTEYLVLSDLEYVGPDGFPAFAVAGATVSDLPADALPSLLLAGHITWVPAAATLDPLAVTA